MSETERVVQSLRAFATVQSELGRVFARTRNMHTTDAAAIVEILAAEQRGRPLTPARLAERLSLTTGAASTLLNRLEDAGHVRRARGHSDRRVVTLHSTPAVTETAEAFFDPLVVRLRAALEEYPDDDLARVAEIADRLRTVTSDYIDATSGT